MRLAIVLNQNLFERSAHMVYLARLAVGLAQSRPMSDIYLIFPKGARGDLSLYDLQQPPNLHLHPLNAVRKPRKKLGFTLNLIFYRQCLRFLKQLNPDIIFAASFPKLCRFLLRNRSQFFPRSRFVYEVHELAELNPHHRRQELTLENEIFPAFDRLFTTTQPLLKRLTANGLRVNLWPLACAYLPHEFPPIKKPGKALRVGYFGSTYYEQGIEWLVKNWPKEHELHIYGPGKFSGPNIYSHAALPMDELRRKVLPEIDALIIPTLPIGRMPFVAITKSYDYLAFQRPIIAADLPSIADVLRPDREAILFKAGEIDSLHQALQKLQENPQLAEQLVKNAAQRAVELSWTKRCEAFWKMMGA